MNPFNAMRATVKEEVGAMSSLPPLLDVTVDLFSKTHLYYRTYKLGQSFNRAASDPVNGNPVVYGAALQLAADHTSMGYALNIALITKCAEDLLREYRQLSERYETFWNLLKDKYPLQQPAEWKREKGHWNDRISPSFLLKQQISIMQVISKITQAVAITFEILKKMFMLSMSMADAYLVLNGDKAARFEGFTELVAEWENYQNQLEEDKNRVLEEIEKGSNLANRILKYLQAPESCINIITTLKAQIGKKGPKKSDNLADDIYDVAVNALDPVFIKGKITPLHIDLSEGMDAPLALPKGRYPPWGGQKVKIVKKPVPKATAPRKRAENGTEWLHKVMEGTDYALRISQKGVLSFVDKLQELIIT